VLERLRTALLRLLRVPPEPTPPVGDPGPPRIFRAAKNFFRYNVLRWALVQLSALAGLLLALLFIRVGRGAVDAPTLWWILSGLELFAWISFLVQLPATYLLLRLDFELRWYLVTGRSLRIREGLLKMREQTMTFANIQNLSVRQGPLQRLLGIADVEVRAAGGGASDTSSQGEFGRGGHVAVFRGVDNAREIRDLVRARVRLQRDAGLGDPDDPGGTETNQESGRIASARGLLEEVRALRSVLSAAATIDPAPDEPEHRS
jgi:membrane protein YdbS with pleckstrin-like domain